jgi:hypothetical protein
MKFPNKKVHNENKDFDNIVIFVLLKLIGKETYKTILLKMARNSFEINIRPCNVIGVSK